MTTARSDERPTPNALDWVGVAAITATGLLCGLLEALLVPLYIGSTIFPIAVVLAIGSNIALPLLSRMLVPRTGIAALPFLAWLLVVVGFGSVSRPEGDVILPGGGPGHVEWVTYGMLLVGVLAGAGTLVATAAPPGPTAMPRGRTATAPQRTAPPRRSAPKPSGPAEPRGSGKGNGSGTSGSGTSRGSGKGRGPGKGRGSGKGRGVSR